MATAKKNPFEKLAAEKAAAVEEVSDATSTGIVDEETEAVDEGTPAVLEEAAEAPAEDVDDSTEPVEEAGADKEKPAASEKPRTRRTAKQVEEEAAAREAALQAQIDALKQAIEGKADAAEISVKADEVLLEGGAGGDVRLVADGRTVVNDDWRATVDGLRLILGRSSMQSTQQFILPLSLIPSLAELLGEVKGLQK